MSLISDITQLAAALIRQPTGDVPIWFTCKPFLYHQNLTKVPVFKINKLDYYYIRTGVDINDQLLLSAKRIIASVLTKTGKPQVQAVSGTTVARAEDGSVVTTTQITVDVGYYGFFFDFRPVLEQAPVTPTDVNVAALIDALNNTHLDPATRQKYLLAIADVDPSNRRNFEKVPLTIPTLRPDEFSKEATKQWNDVRKYAYQQLRANHINTTTRSMALNNRIPFSPRSRETSPIIDDPQIAAELIRYRVPISSTPGPNYQPTSNKYDRDTQFSLDVNLELMKLIPLDYLKGLVYNAIMHNGDDDYHKLVNDIVPFTKDYNLLKMVGFGHHELALDELGDWGLVGANLTRSQFVPNLTVADLESIAIRYPYPIYHMDIDQFSMETRVKMMKAEPIEFDSKELLDVCMQDPTITPLRKAAIVAKYYGEIMLESIYGSSRRFDQTYLDLGESSHIDLDVLDDCVTSLLPYVGIHPYIDTAIQQKICTMHGYNLQELIEDKLLFVAVQQFNLKMEAPAPSLRVKDNLIWSEVDRRSDAIIDPMTPSVIQVDNVPAIPPNDEFNGFPFFVYDNGLALIEPYMLSALGLVNPDE